MSSTTRTGAELVREINETRVPYGMLAVWYLGQVSVVVKGSDAIVYIDPYLASAPYRRYAPPLRPEEATNADCVLITHEHIDHLDPDTVPTLAANRADTTFVAPAACHDMMRDFGVAAERIVTATTGEWLDLPGFRCKPIPAAHEELDEDPVLGHRFVGYILDMNGVTFYHAGDTTIYPGLVETLRSESIDVAMLPINGRDAFRRGRNILGNMNVREAAELAAEAGIDTVIPCHYDMFEGNKERPGAFVDYLEEFYPGQKKHIMARFERYIYISDRALRGREGA